MADLVHSDRAVARRILGGDQAAFQELFDRFFPRLYRFALVRLGGDSETARDVVQQTFCNAIEHLDRYRGEAALYTWFCQICRNVVADHFRRRGAGAPRVVLLEDQPNVRAILESLTAPAGDEPETGVWHAQVQRRGDARHAARPPCRGARVEVRGRALGQGNRAAPECRRQGGGIAVDPRARILPRRDRADGGRGGGSRRSARPTTRMNRHE
jgi:RNA polymerase sigma factor (sigma-70 family)